MRNPSKWLAVAAALWCLAGFSTAQQPTPGDALAPLRAEVAAAESVRSIKRLQHSLAQFLEWGLWNEAQALFAADATATFGSEALRGPAAIAAHYQRESGASGEGLARGQINTHLIMQPIVTLGPDGRTARATWHEFSMLGAWQRAALWRGGIYENEYVQQRGRWVIQRIRFFPQYEGSYEQFGHRAPPRWNIPYHFEARHVGLTVTQSALVSLQAASRDDVATLSRRLQRLDDETAVQNLQHSLGYYLDRKHWDDVTDLFAGAGTLQFGNGRAARGAVAIRQLLEQQFGAAGLLEGELFDRLQFATVVTVAADGRTASARSLVLGMLGRNGQFAAWETGVFENRFVREEGRWKLAAVHYFPRMRTNFDLGWARDASAPLAFGYGSYPAMQFVGFSFPHPVTGRPIGARGGVSPAMARGGQPPVSDTDVAALRRRAHAAIAIDAVENLNSSYGYYIDESDWNGMADTFGSAGAKEVTGAGVYVGTERIRAVLNRRGPAGGRTPNFFTIHQLVQPVIHIDADGLTARARLRLFQCGGNADASSGSWIGGIYENTAVFEQGEWKFGIQDLHHLFNAPYRNGWARLGAAALASLPPVPVTATASPGGGAIQQGLGGAARPQSFVTELPPDRPIRSPQYTFPRITEPAFHYRNPVSGRRPAELLFQDEK